MRCSPSKFILGTNKIIEFTEQWVRGHKQEQGWPNNRHTGMEGLHPAWMMAFPRSHRWNLVLGPSSPVSSKPSPRSRDHVHLWETAHIWCGWVTGYSGEGPGTSLALLLWEKANRQYVQLYVWRSSPANSCRWQQPCVSGIRPVLQLEIIWWKKEKRSKKDTGLWHQCLKDVKAKNWWVHIKWDRRTQRGQWTGQLSVERPAGE